MLQRELLDDADLAPPLLLGAGRRGRPWSDLRSLMRAFGSDWDLVERPVLTGHRRAAPSCPTSTALADEATRSAPALDECTDAERQVPARPAGARRWADGSRAAADDGDTARGAARRPRAEDPAIGRKGNWAGLDRPRSAGDCQDVAVARIGVRTSRSGRRAAAPGPVDRRSGSLEAAEERRGARAGWSSTTCWCWPATCCATDAEVARPRCSDQLPAAAARRVPGHRPDPDRARRAASPAARRRRGPMAGRRRPAGVAVRGRRPEAVDLPVPAGRHRACTCGAGQVGGAGHPDDQLPHRRADPRLGQPRVRPADRGRARDAAGLPAAGTRTGPSRGSGPAVTVLGAEPHRTGRRRRSCASARPPTSPPRSRRAHRPSGGRCRTSDRRRGATSDSADIAILVPARTSLPFLEDALDAAGIAVPRRVQLAGLPGAARSATCSPPPGPSPTRATSSRWSPRCARRCSAAATTTCGPGSTAAARSTSSRRLRQPTAPTTRWRRALDLPARAALPSRGG